MLLKDVMTAGVECVGLDDTIQTAARKMRDLDAGPVPVCGDNDQLAGVLTDRDITIRAVAEGMDPTKYKVQDAMTPDVVYCFDDEPVERAERVMKDKQIRRLLVLNRNKRLVGIVSLGDLAVRGESSQKVGEVLQDVSEPVAPL
ncbi:CBS domain-containing protein [bacterium]|nr:CBS domain-containing protein [bacterium]